MCRWLAYIGEPVQLEVLLFKPRHSLIDQSLHARLNYTGAGEALATNGDGFGVGWYDQEETPGLYRDTRPAWNDKNLRDLAHHIRSPLFLSHIRATDAHNVQRSNCHPFRHANWLFQHNGRVGDYARLKRDLDLTIAPEFYASRLGNTDSETCFYLMLTFGLAEDPVGALSRMVSQVEKARREHSVELPLTLTCAFTDGSSVYALRYSSNQQSKTLFYSGSIRALRDLHGECETLPANAKVIVSEPLDDLSEHWVEVPESTLLIADASGIRTQTFEPEV